MSHLRKPGQDPYNYKTYSLRFRSCLFALSQNPEAPKEIRNALLVAPPFFLPEGNETAPPVMFIGDAQLWKNDGATRFMINHAAFANAWDGWRRVRVEQARVGAGLR